ncbi:hypothetical protein L484_022992 [Morus notabilis]|uniref:Uncharacterized protein n=1 Tax=Morus notabilis TaxID=981085 RepID=W9RK19_9ROSA|nr:hypothetical protein L484_022992 [Morus notabilis]
MEFRQAKRASLVNFRWGKLKAERIVGNPLEKLYLDKPHDASGSHHSRDEEIPKTRTIDSFCTSPLAKGKEFLSLVSGSCPEEDLIVPEERKQSHAYFIFTSCLYTCWAVAQLLSKRGLPT